MQNKKEVIQIRVNPEEKNLIEEKAREFGGSVSEYARTVLQNPDKDLGGKLGQALAAALCQHAALVERVHDPHIRAELSRWELGLWQRM